MSVFTTHLYAESSITSGFSAAQEAGSLLATQRQTHSRPGVALAECLIQQGARIWAST